MPDPSPTSGCRWLQRLKSLFAGSTPPAAPLSDTPESARDSALGRASGQLEKQLFANIANLGALEVYDVMVPRADIIAIDSKAPTVEILSILRGHSFMRFPVFRHTLDDVIGYLEIRKVFELISQGKPLDVQQLLQAPLYVVRSTRLLDLLVQMRSEHVYLAVVVDEYGGLDGLLTIEDVMEAIVGTVQNTDALSGPNMTEQDDGSLLVDARTELVDFEARIERTLEMDEDDRDEIDTVGGLVYLLAGRIPVRGEVVTFDERLQFEVLEADPRRLRVLKAVYTRDETTGGELVPALAAE